MSRVPAEIVRRSLAQVDVRSANASAAGHPSVSSRIASSSSSRTAMRVARALCFRLREGSKRRSTASTTRSDSPYASHDATGNCSGLREEKSQRGPVFTRSTSATTNFEISGSSFAHVQVVDDDQRVERANVCCGRGRKVAAGRFRFAYAVDCGRKRLGAMPARGRPLRRRSRARTVSGSSHRTARRRRPTRGSYFRYCRDPRPIFRSRPAR